MPSYMTVNKVGPDGCACKYDVYDSLEAAEARIAELHLMPGYEGAFIVDADAAAVNGQMPFQEPRHFPVDVVNERVNFSQTAFDATALVVAAKEWQQSMDALDGILSRVDEDAYNAQPAEVQAKYPEVVRERIAMKVALRGAKP